VAFRHEKAASVGGVESVGLALSLAENELSLRQIFSFTLVSPSLLYFFLTRFSFVSHGLSIFAP